MTYNNLPNAVKAFLSTWNENTDNIYKECERIQEGLKTFGYYAEFGLGGGMHEPLKYYPESEILRAENLYELQDNFSSSGVPFYYEMTEGEIEWLNFVKNRYSIANWINKQKTGNVLCFNCPDELKEALETDGIYPKAPMLSDESALQKLFFWLA